MERLWPAETAGALTDADLEALYAYPGNLEALGRPWVQVNFVASSDGAVTLEGRSEGLSHPADKRIYTLGRDLADVVLVGAGTARAERYRGVRRSERRIERRRRLGLPTEVPPIAVVSGRCTVSPVDPVLADTHVPTIVLTTENAPDERKDDVVAAGGEVIVAGKDDVDVRAALKALAERGLLRVNCEGGPQLFATLIAEDLVDQLCLTIAPLLAGAGADRIASGRIGGVPRHLRLASLLHEDGFMMARYLRADVD